MLEPFDRKGRRIFMKKLIVLILLLSGFNLYANAVTESLAWTLAETIYVTALTGATSEVSSEISNIKDQKAHAVRIQNDVQEYFLANTITPFLEAHINEVQKLNSNLSIDESIEALIMSTEIILKKAQ